MEVAKKTVEDGMFQKCEEKYFVAIHYMVYNCKYSEVFLKTVS